MNNIPQESNYSSREVGRSLNRNDHVSFGDINALNGVSAYKRMTSSATNQIPRTDQNGIYQEI